MSHTLESVRRGSRLRGLLLGTSAAIAVALAAAPAAPAVSWSVPGAGATVKATPYPTGQTRVFGFPLQYGDGHVCVSDGNDYRSLRVDAELAPYEDRRGGYYLKEERQSPDYSASPRPGPISGVGIGTVDTSATGQRPVNGRVGVFLTVSARCDGSLVDKYSSVQTVKLTVVLDAAGRAPQVPAFATAPTGTAPSTPAADAPATAKPKSILNAKSKRTLAAAAQRLRGFAANASALSRVCILGGLKKEALKQSLKAAAKDLATSYVPLIGDIPTDPCSAAMTAFIGIVTLEADGFDRLAADPPDPRFRKIARASVRVPIAYRGSKPAAGVASALNALTVNLARTRANLAALLTSVERAQGASAAKRSDWAKKQNRAARRFAGEAATALAGSPAAIRRLAAALKAAGYGAAALSPTEATAFRQQVQTAGLPREIDAALTVLGASSTMREQLRADVQGATPGALAKTGFPGLLTSSGVAASMRSVVSTLRALARG